MRDWLGGLSFTASLMVRSAIYAAIIIPIQVLQLGERHRRTAPRNVQCRFSGPASSIPPSSRLLMNLGFGITNIIGPRAFLNFVIGRYHSPVEENRFVLFVDIAGSTGLPSGSAASAFIAFSIARFVCLRLRWWIIAARCSIMSATR